MSSFKDPNGAEAGVAFLTENKSKEGVITLASGLQYKVLAEGTGLKHPLVGTPCECHYAGRLLDGTEFDSSYKRGTPTTFAPNQVIKGWTEAMQLMVVGDKWEMYIPYELAYGASGKPPKIPAAATLIFIMEIIKIKGDTNPMISFPEWTAEELSTYWLEPDEAACATWRATKEAKYDDSEPLKAKYPTREALGAWLDKQCAATKNETLWKRTKAAKRPKPPAPAPITGTPAPGCDGTCYEIVKAGSGAKITKGCTATVHAVGVIRESGKQFWSTHDAGQEPFEYQAGVGSVIKGWDQGCLGMAVGETRKLTIPGDEGYGAAGFPAWGITANATLEFTLECLSVA